MYAITGATGQVGGAMARTLLADRRSVKAVVRDAEKGRSWAARGSEVAIATMEDASALTAAFTGAEGVFIVPPSEFDPAPGFPEARAVIEAVKAALEAAAPRKVICLSTVGAQAKQTNLLTQRMLMEQALSELNMPVAFLRPGWFMENFRWDIPSARDAGVIASFLQPADKPVPMIATADVGRVAAELIQENWTGRRIVELEYTKRISPNEVAATLAEVLGRSVRVEEVPRESWAELFKSQGMKDPLPRMRMLDGFNEGWIEFEGGESASIKRKVSLSTVLRGLIEATP
jgi:NAD(P)H dehydrogenase (quinone)